MATADRTEFYIACIELGGAIESFKHDLHIAQGTDGQAANATRVLALIETPVENLIQRLQSALSRMRAAAAQEEGE